MWIILRCLCDLDTDILVSKDEVKDCKAIMDSLAGADSFTDPLGEEMVIVPINLSKHQVYQYLTLKLDVRRREALEVADYLGDQVLIEAETMRRPDLTRDACFISLAGDLLALYHRGPKVKKFQLDRLLAGCGQSNIVKSFASPKHDYQARPGSKSFYYDAGTESICIRTERGWFKCTTDTTELVSLPFAAPQHIDLEKSEALMQWSPDVKLLVHRFYLEEGLSPEEVIAKYTYRRDVGWDLPLKQQMEAKLVEGRDSIWDGGRSYNAIWRRDYDPSKYSVYNIYRGEGRCKVFDTRGIIYFGQDKVFELKSHHEHVLVYNDKQIVTYSMRNNDIVINRYSHSHIEDKSLVSVQDLHRLENISCDGDDGSYDLRTDLAYYAILIGHELTVYDYSCL